jgi:hypothetical protein
MQGECAGVDGASELGLPSTSFVFERCVEVAPFDLVELDPQGTKTGVDPTRVCDAVAIAAPNLGTVGVWWGDTTVRPVSSEDPDRSERGLLLRQIGRNLFLEPAAVSLTWTFPQEMRLRGCGVE